MAEKEIDS